MRILAEEILHQLTYCGIITVCAVYIYYARFVAVYGITHVGYAPCYCVHRKSGTEIVVFRYEYHIGLGEFLKVISGIKRVAVQQAAVIPSALRNCSLVAALYLNVVFRPGAVNSVDVQLGGTSLNVFQFVLRYGFLHSQVVTAEDYPEQKLRTGFILKHLAHERIVHQPEIPDYLFLFLTVVK